MTLQQQYLAKESVTGANPDNGGEAVNDNSKIVDIRSAAAGNQRQLIRSEAEQDKYRQKERELEVHCLELSNGLQAKSEEDGHLRRTEKTAGYIALPSPFVMGLGAAVHSPVIAILGALMLLGALALKLYAKARIDRIEKVLASMQAEYRQSSEELNSIRIQSEKLMRELRRLKEGCGGTR
ncbi:MAG: hypothetical protein AB2L14_34915 [Candidatus Xenobiia bacterium LiM19]